MEWAQARPFLGEAESGEDSWGTKMARWRTGQWGRGRRMRKKEVKTAQIGGSAGGRGIWGRPLQKAEGGFEFMEKCNSLPSLLWPLWRQRGDWIGDMETIRRATMFQERN